MEDYLKKFAMVAYSSEETIQNTYDMSMYCIENNIKGSFVECGVAAGAQVGVMAYACDSAVYDGRKIFAFDSYKGIPFCSENDDQEAGLYYLDKPKPFVEDKETLLVPTGATVHSLESVKKNLEGWGVSMHRIKFVEGWFQHTLVGYELLHKVDKIALLRLDGDLYESTMVCLNKLFPKVSEGGVVIIDDYALSGCRKAVDEYFKKKKYSPDYKKIENSTPVYFLK